MKEITYIEADVRVPIEIDKDPIENRRKLIIHCCNDIGRMGSGVALALMTKWPQVREKYIKWSKEDSFALGMIQPVRVEYNIVVVNMIGQHDIKTTNGIPPIRYDAMTKCLYKVANLALKYNASVHLPYLMGCDLAGGDWVIIEEKINFELCSRDIDVVAYDINNRREKT